MEEQRRQICQLWNQEYPKRLKFQDLEAFTSYLNKLKIKKQYVIYLQEERIRGWAFVFERDNKTWFAIILASEFQGKGVGTKIFRRIQLEEEELYGWVIDHDMERKSNGEMYKSLLGFYLRNGFEILQEQRLETDNISAVKMVWRKK